jgi:hypothetical protein
MIADTFLPGLLTLYIGLKMMAPTGLSFQLAEEQEQLQSHQMDIFLLDAGRVVEFYAPQTTVITGLLFTPKWFR